MCMHVECAGICILFLIPVMLYTHAFLKGVFRDVTTPMLASLPVISREPLKLL